MDRENMRVIVSKRMIREGLLRCLQKKSIEKITITELCREAQVNRTTFYNHYSIPADVLNEISAEIVTQIEKIYQSSSSVREATMAALAYLKNHKDILKVIFSSNFTPSGYTAVLNAIVHFWDSRSDLKNDIHLNEDEYQLAVTGYGWAGYYIIRQWIMDDIDMSEEQIMTLFDKLFGRKTDGRN